MAIENEAEKDLALSDDEAENVAGGRSVSKHHKPTTHTVAGAVDGNVESTDAKTGTPSPLGPLDEDSYMDTNP